MKVAAAHETAERARPMRLEEAAREATSLEAAARAAIEKEEEAAGKTCAERTSRRAVDIAERLAARLDGPTVGRRASGRVARTRPRKAWGPPRSGHWAIRSVGSRRSGTASRSSPGCPPSGSMSSCASTSGIPASPRCSNAVESCPVGRCGCDRGRRYGAWHRRRRARRRRRSLGESFVSLGLARFATIWLSL
jgi:hypothetical protein